MRHENKAPVYTIAFCLISVMPICKISADLCQSHYLTTILSNHRKITIDSDYVMFFYLGHRLYTAIMISYYDNPYMKTKVVVVMAVSLPMASKSATGDDVAIFSTTFCFVLLCLSIKVDMHIDTIFIQSMALNVLIVAETWSLHQNSIQIGQTSTSRHDSRNFSRACGGCNITSKSPGPSILRTRGKGRWHNQLNPCHVRIVVFFPRTFLTWPT